MSELRKNNTRLLSQIYASQQNNLLPISHLLSSGYLVGQENNQIRYIHYNLTVTFWNANQGQSLLLIVCWLLKSNMLQGFAIHCTLLYPSLCRNELRQRANNDRYKDHLDWQLTTTFWFTKWSRMTSVKIEQKIYIR